MKYRRLTLDELALAEHSFVEFLAINGIDRAMWASLKVEPEKAAKLLDAFSDAWFEMHLRKIKYIEMLLENEILCFQCNIQNIVLVGLKFETKSTEGLSMLDRVQTAVKAGKCEVYTTSKTYSERREKELFNMLEKGAVVTDGALFKNISLALSN